MYSIAQLFKWQQAIDSKDVSFVPDNIETLVGKKFIITNIIENSIFPPGTVIELQDIEEPRTTEQLFQHTYNFICNGEEEIFWWCEVYPYKEEDE